MAFVAGCCVVGLAWMLVDNNQQATIEEVLVNEITPSEVNFEGPLSFDDWVNEVSELNRSSVVALHLVGDSSNDIAQAILLRDDGHLVTSSHAIERADEITAEFAGGQLPAQLIGADTVSGIAVLKINSPNLPPPTFGDESQVLVRDRLVALAHSVDGDDSALAVDLLGEGHVATSISGTPLSNLYSLSDDLNETWAGSALLSEEGGIVAMAVHANDGSYAVPITLARRVANQLIADGTANHKAWLGVETSAALSDDLKEDRGLRGGLLLTRVWDETPAARAGLVAGDIITRAGSVNVLDRTDFLEALAALEPGDTLEIAYSRAQPIVEVNNSLSQATSTSAVADGSGIEDLDADERGLLTTTVVLGARPG